MATLLFTAVGTLVGGPIGGAIGAIAGRSIDGAIIDGGKREGPRLKDLSVTTSSYGQPIARHHGRMRAAGTIVWATDLVEHSSRSGGGKGKPKVTSYFYSASFAVALSSRPILDVGRIWADGNLLRGAGGDLKTGGLLRVYTGHGDQMPDPLIAAAQGADCPAFRDCAYVVFEDLSLEDFGNRIPALTFEVIADVGRVTLDDIVVQTGSFATAQDTIGSLIGFANEGGPLSATLATIDSVFPLSIDAGGDRLSVALAATDDRTPPLLPPSVRGWDEDDAGGSFGIGDGARDIRDDAGRERPDALRYYDVARDYQAGIQRPAGRARGGRPTTIEFPGALAADDARMLVDAAARREIRRKDLACWRVAELDPAIAPGSGVRVPGRSGLWRVESWEWRARGVELELARCVTSVSPALKTDPGVIFPVPDLVPGTTVLAAFEVPPESANADEPVRFAAATAINGTWNGAALYFDRAGELVPVGRAGKIPATIGVLAEPLAGAPSAVFDRAASLEVTVFGANAGFAPASLATLTSGANRLLVGAEIVQFALANEIAPGRWRLGGLLRGRGGTEAAAKGGHATGTQAVLLDDALVALDTSAVPGSPDTVIAAIGTGDEEPVFASLSNPGLGLRPLCPVHPVADGADDGGLILGWRRRARGAWTWANEVDVPLVEEVEAYSVGLGPVSAPWISWTTSSCALHVDASRLAALTSSFPGAPLWVRQIGRHAQSDPLLLTHLPS